jgi:hypothetical protein
VVSNPRPTQLVYIFFVAFENKIFGLQKKNIEIKRFDFTLLLGWVNDHWYQMFISCIIARACGTSWLGSDQNRRLR